MSEIFLWIKAVFFNWWWLMSCAVFTIVGFIAMALHKSTKWALYASLCATVVMIMVASFFAWRSAYRQAEGYKTTISEMQKELDALKQPNLLGNIVQVGSIDVVLSASSHVTNYPWGNAPTRFVAAMVWMRIKNSGADSIAEDYSIMVTLNSGKELHGYMMKIPTDIPPSNWRERILLESASPLVEKTVAKPIVKGGQEVGLVMFALEPGDYSREDISEKGVIYDVSFHDVNGTEYHVKKALQGSGGRDPGYVPGSGRQ